MAEYDVPLVEQKYLHLWRDCNSRAPSKKAIKANRNAKLKQTVNIKACSIDEAYRIAQSKYPDHFIDKDGIIHLG